MGLITAAGASLASVLGDQWKEYFYCSEMDADVLVRKGQHHTGKSGLLNRGGSENVITNGSTIVVNEGQCMIIVDQGAIVDVCAQPGAYTYDASTEPSVFTGGLGAGLAASFEQFKARFTYGGVTAHDQRVYYFNTKDIIGNKYGTVNPVPFRVVDTNIGLDMDVSLKCHGEYSYRIIDPVLFYKNLVGNVSDEFKRDKIDSQLKSELLTALQPAFAKISEMGIRYSALPGHTTEIADALNEVLSKKWREFYGIEISSFGVSSVTANEEDEKTIKELQRAGALRNPNMAAATIASAQAQAMQDAANNTATGPMMAFAGMNMAQQAGGMNAGQLFQMGAQQPAPAPAPAPQMAPQGAQWTCSCGAVNNGNFCTQCGSKRPAAGWTCSCGAVNTGNFCSQCGSPRPNA